MTSILVKTPDYIVHGFQTKTENFDSGKQRHHQNGYLKGSRMAQIAAP